MIEKLDLAVKMRELRNREISFKVPTPPRSMYRFLEPFDTYLRSEEGQRAVKFLRETGKKVVVDSSTNVGLASNGYAIIDGDAVIELGWFVAAYYVYQHGDEEHADLDNFIVSLRVALGIAVDEVIAELNLQGALVNRGVVG